ncbi:hypothetical protein, conserved [Trypanosoma brucei gambiense DAL972]|uniref:Serine/threonine-protein phosphatase 4 regulatory subunit 4 n=1 Tax=Trypanosoma brucei gambiense (strain MHOM/CI/86/DAL972) TaxID=679716 RepID=D0A6Y8_TRYB9|nr:hypothetical protein, conserved [Trypanosoma brucei gambiense DAL972]CBH17439.1 hypothetical protein, conserved [Trypanosoma brucei gambiense DAL972]|eukprot:XP_011779703.1 hypothetical protein, conserved [Trypanosoma brucei gambiense DAL972]
MEYKSVFELRQHIADNVTPPKGRHRPPVSGCSGSSVESSPSSGYSGDAGMDAILDDPTALVCEVPGLDKLRALSVSLKNEEAVQNYVEARNLSVEEATRYIMNNGSTGQKKSLFQRLGDTLNGLEMTAMSQVLMIVVDFMWVQDPELQCFAPGALLGVLPLLSSSVVRELMMVTSTMLNVKTAEIRIAWNKLFLAFVDHLTAKQLDNDVVPLALKKAEHIEPQDQRELSCDLIGAVCHHLPRDIVERKLLNKVLALCQDTNVGVRRHMCQQLGTVARSLGVDKAKEKVAQELFELLNDEDQTVSRAAFSCLIDLVEFFGPAYRRERLYPIIRGFISHPPEEVVSLIVGEFGRFLWEIKADIQTSDDVAMFATFYQDAALKGDDHTRYRCAYNLPSVVASLPVDVFPTHLAPCCEALSTDVCESVCQSLASGLHELVKLIGDRAAEYLRKPFLNLLHSSKKSVLKALSGHTCVLLDCFSQQLKPADRTAFFLTIEDILLDLASRADRDWRIMEYVLNILCSYYKELNEASLHEKFLPVLLRYEKYGAYCLKNQCAEMCIKISAALCSVNSKVQFFSKLNNEYAHSPLASVRQGYLRFVRAACGEFSRRFIRERMLECCFELQHDNMEGVRLELARVLPLLRKVLEPLTTGTVLDEYQDMVRRLQMDDSSEVRAVAVDSVDIIEARERELKRDAGKNKFEEESREDRRREMSEGQLLDVAKEYDKAERRSKLRDLLKSEREKEQAEATRKLGVGRRSMKPSSAQSQVKRPQQSPVRAPIAGPSRQKRH